MDRVGLIAIGRNEGERLRQCLTSAIAQASHVLYVDSGSTDHSLDIARSLGVSVVSLDLSIPFTAARARNAGFEQLLKSVPNLDYIQFIDGDCELVQGWIEQAVRVLDEQPSLAVACGRRRERYPDESVYNKLCDLEWDTPIGETNACGGDALVRVTAFNQVNGFNPTLIAGEEPELCVRLRQKGWRIFRIDADMTLHDAQMYNVGQWWRRFQRAGHAYAEGAWLHGQLPERHWVKESYSIWIWGLAVPIVSLSLIFYTQGLSLLLLSLYPLCIYKIYRYGQQHGFKRRDAVLYATSCVLGKFPGVQGQLIFHWNRLTGRSKQIIEYK
ncbi:glycosyltransferase [Nodosilinea sp. E11]|uniref:glycosyltransferase n=1 Tax=Nodosilinea sp. E11 TaxID=3037479 RepID=UPI003977C3F7